MNVSSNHKWPKDDISMFSITKWYFLVLTNFSCNSLAFCSSSIKKIGLSARDRRMWHHPIPEVCYILRISDSAEWTKFVFWLSPFDSVGVSFTAPSVNPPANMLLRAGACCKKQCCKFQLFVTFYCWVAVYKPVTVKQTSCSEWRCLTMTTYNQAAASVCWFIT